MGQGVGGLASRELGPPLGSEGAWWEVVSELRTGYGPGAWLGVGERGGRR